jgi:acetoin utilization protein AcuB
MPHKVVRDYMTRDAVCLRETERLRAAVELVIGRHIRHMPILDGAGRLVGIVTDRDVKRVLPSPLSSTAADEYEAILETTPLSRVMTREPLTVGPEMPMAEAIRILLSNRIGGLPVVEKGRLVGILTERDALRGYVELLERL